MTNLAAQLNCCMPETKFNQTFKFLLGIVAVRLLIEDRRPDLEEYHSKYKTYLWVMIFGKKVFHRLSHSSRMGFLYVKNEEVSLFLGN